MSRRSTWGVSGLTGPVTPIECILLPALCHLPLLFYKSARRREGPATALPPPFNIQPDTPYRPYYFFRVAMNGNAVKRKLSPRDDQNFHCRTQPAPTAISSSLTGTYRRGPESQRGNGKQAGWIQRPYHDEVPVSSKKIVKRFKGNRLRQRRLTARVRRCPILQKSYLGHLH